MAKGSTERSPMALLPIVLFEAPGGSPLPPQHAPGPYPYPAGVQQTRTSGLAVTSMVLGIIAICTIWLVWIPVLGWFSFAPAALAIIFGGISLNHCNKDPNLGGKGMAVTGLVPGIIVAVSGFPFRVMWFGM